MQDLFGRAAGRALPEVRPLLRVHGLLQRAATTTAGAPQVPALQRAHRRRALHAPDPGGAPNVHGVADAGHEPAAATRRGAAQGQGATRAQAEPRRGEEGPAARPADAARRRRHFARVQGPLRHPRGRPTATPFVKPPPVLPAAAPPAPAAAGPQSAAAADLLLRAASAPPPPRPVPPAYELRTSEFTLVSHAHGRAAERGIQRRELQAAIKHGEKVAANPGRRGEKRWRFTHQGVVYITDETMRHEITSWRLDGGAVPPPQRWAGPPLAAHYVVIVDHSGSMNAKDCLDDCGGKITRLEAAYDTLLNSYVKETRENAPGRQGHRRIPVAMSTKAEVIFERYRLGLAEDAISNHAKVAYAHDHGNYLPALAEVERLFSQPIDAEGSHALGVVLLTDGKPSDTVTDPRFVSPALRGYDRIIAQLSWLLRDLEQKVDERFPLRLQLTGHRRIAGRVQDPGRRQR